MGRSRYHVIEPSKPHFLTCTIVGWLPLFGQPELAEIVLDSWRFLQSRERLKLYAYVVMENHLHLIASADDLAKEVGDFKSFTARRIIDHLEATNRHLILEELAFRKCAHKEDRRYQVWQEGSHPQWVQCEEMMPQKLGYVHDNPVKRGYVDDPAHWRYSSARNYAGRPGLVEVCCDWL